MHGNLLTRRELTWSLSLVFLTVASSCLAPAFGKVKPARGNSGGHSTETSRSIQTPRVAGRRRFKNTTHLVLRGGDQSGKYLVLRPSEFYLAAGSSTDTLGSHARLQGSGNNSLANTRGGLLSNAGSLRFPSAKAGFNINGRAANLSGGIDPLINSAWNAGTGNWNTATAWTPVGVPNNGGGNTFNVTIDSGGADLVSLDINPTIASLVVGGTAGSSTLQNKSGTAQTLNITGALTVKQTGAISFSNGSTLTVGGNATNAGSIDLEKASKLNISGSLTNSGRVSTNFLNGAVGANTLTVTGGFTNNANASFDVGFFDNTSDVANVATLANSGSTMIGHGATLNLTSQPNGITDVLGGSTLEVRGTLKAGANNGLAKLNSAEGFLIVDNGATTAATPGSGTLTLSSTGALDVDRKTTLTVTGNLANSGKVTTNFFNAGVGANTLTVTGGFTNNPNASFDVGFFDNTSDVANVATLANSGSTMIGHGATLNLTSQPNGITDVLGGSTLEVRGTLKAGVNNGLAKLNSAEGFLIVDNGATTAATPGSGTLTLSSAGALDVDRKTTLTVTGNLANSGKVTTNFLNGAVGANTLTVTGGFTNNANASFDVGFFDNTSDVANVATLANSGSTMIGHGATLNLTSQPNGITDVLGGSTLEVRGTLKAGANNGLAKLNSAEGFLIVDNGATTAATPGSGTLTLSSTGALDVDRKTTLTVTGNLANSGKVTTNFLNGGVGANTLTVTGGFTNNANASFDVGFFDNTSDVANVATLANSGSTMIGHGATLNLTSQPNGITDVLGGSTLEVRGTLKAGANNGLAKLNSAEGFLIVDNGATTAATPGSGTLTLSSTGALDVDRKTTLTVTGNLANSGKVTTNFLNGGVGANTLTVTGGFTNNTGAMFNVGIFNNTSDVANVGTLTNSGAVTVGTGATLNLTAAGTDNNSGSIGLTASTLKVSGSNVNLTGAGTITLSNSANNLITGGTTGGTLTTSNTIQGSGKMQNLGIVNSGTILANQSVPLIILPTVAGLNNQGKLTVNSGSTMQIGTSSGGALKNFSGTTLTGGTYLDSGTLEFGGAGTKLVTNAASITLTGASSQIIDFSSENILSGFSTNAAGAAFILAGGRSFTTAGNFTNNGTLVVGGGSTFDVNGNLTNFSGTTLTGGTYTVGGKLQFNGANIVTNAASITLAGVSSKIVNQTAADGLANFATNASTGSFTISGGRNFTTAGNFTNNGSLTVGTGSKFIVNGNLTNFSGTTLTGGTYNVSGSLQFNGAKIVTNAASVTLTGTGSKIVNQTAVNALTNFATNAAAGSFTLAGNQTLTTAGGSFANAGKLTVSTGSTFTVGNGGITSIPVNYTQTAGTTTVDGILTSSAASSTPTLNLNGGSLFGTGTLGYAVVDASTLTPADSATKTGALAVSGTYTQKPAGVLNISIGGTTPGTKYDQLNVTGSATLNGTLNLTRINGFVPAVGNIFDVVNTGSFTGTFSTVNGTAINGSEHFVVSYDGSDVDVTVVSGPVAAVRAGLASPTDRARNLRLRSFGLDGRGSLIDSPHSNSRLAALAAVALPAIGKPLLGGNAGFGTSRETSGIRTLGGFAQNSPISRATLIRPRTQTMQGHAEALKVYAPSAPKFSLNLEQNVGAGRRLGTVDLSASPHSRPPIYSSNKLQTSPSAYLGFRATTPATRASTGLMVRQNVAGPNANPAFSLGGPNAPIAPPNFVRAAANSALPSRINLPRTAGMPGRESLYFSFKVLPLLGMSPKHFLRDFVKQPGTSNLGYVTFRSN